MSDFAASFGAAERKIGNIKASSKFMRFVKVKIIKDL